jgi:hypothetical protein
LTQQTKDILTERFYKQLMETVELEKKIPQIFPIQLAGFYSMMNETVTEGFQQEKLAEGNLYRGILGEISGQ